MKETCREVLEKAFLYIDGEVLSSEERTVMRLHLEECAPCFERLGLEQEVLALINRLAGSERCPGALRNRIVALIDESPT